MPIRICRVVTAPISFETLYYKQIVQLTEQGFDVSLISSPGPVLNEFTRELNLVCHPVSIKRTPSPIRDLISLFHLFRIIRKERFNIVHSSTPKAGLLAMIAAILSGVPIRIHTYTGQVWFGRNDIKARIYRTCDKVIGRLCTACYADSSSQKLFLTSQKIVSGDEIEVLGSGSVSGVDLNRFNPKKYDEQSTKKIRRELGIDDGSTVIIFVGRLTRDKGIGELIAAFKKLLASHSAMDLVLIGPLEYERDPLLSETIAEISTNPKIHSIGFSSNPERYLSVADIFCIPSYREGFGSVAIEAGAMGLPTVATRVIGLVDAVVEGKTGLLVPPKDAQALAKALQALITDADKRRTMGEAARKRAVGEFDADTVNQLVADEYRKHAAELSE